MMLEFNPRIMVGLLLNISFSFASFSFGPPSYSNYRELEIIKLISSF
jgi:hypothetical protein